MENASILHKKWLQEYDDNQADFMGYFRSKKLAEPSEPKQHLCMYLVLFKIRITNQYILMNDISNNKIFGFLQGVNGKSFYGYCC